MAYTHALLTRPEPQLTELAGWVESAHLTPVNVPAFTFTATDEVVGPDAAWRNQASCLLVFTSPRAVEYGLPALPDHMLRESHIASVGPATTRALADAGLEALQAPGPTFDSEALLDMVKATLEPGAAVILAAPGGREAIQSGLEAMGWLVRLVPVYRREPLEPEPGAIAELEKAEGVISIWTSGTALGHVLDKLSEKAARRVRAGIAIVVSERLMKLARELGLGDVRLSAGPSNSDLLKAIHEANG